MKTSDCFEVIFLGISASQLSPHLLDKISKEPYFATILLTYTTPFASLYILSYSSLISLKYKNGDGQ
jgi:hypothetical protein